MRGSPPADCPADRVGQAGAYNGYTRAGYIEGGGSRRSSSPKLQPLITTTEGLEVMSESGSSTRTW